MPWPLILQTIIALLPYIADWLDLLFKETAEAMPRAASVENVAFARDLDDFFERVKRRTWVWNVAKRRAILQVKRMMLERAIYIRHSAANGGRYVPPLRGSELVAYAAAMQAADGKPGS